jgi:hypothetical protein
MGSTLTRLSFLYPVSAVVLALLGSCGGDSNTALQGVPAAAAATSSGSAIAPLRITLELSGAKEVPPTPSAATGAAVVTVDPVSRQFTVVATTTGIAGTAAHIHEGAATDSGPVVFPMSETAAGSGVWTTSGQLTDAQMIALLAERYYINVHSVAFPRGEIRGQIPEE